MSFYVSLSAEEMGAELWTTHENDKHGQEGNKPGNIAPEQHEKEGQEHRPKSLSGK
jgi:hypothetical protein